MASGLRVGVTAGRRGPELVDALTRLGACVTWAPTVDGDGIPAGTVPAPELLRMLCAGEIDAMAFTSPPAVDGLFGLSASLGIEAAVVAALTGSGPNRVIVAAMGPATAETLERRAVRVSVCPLQPRIPALASALVAAPLAFRCFGGAEPVLIDPQRRTLTGPGGVVELSDRQFALAASLARRPGLTCPTGVLLREVWGDGISACAVARRRLEVLASRLRASLGPTGVHLVTVPKRGYRLDLVQRTGLPSGSAGPPPVG